MNAPTSKPFRPWNLEQIQLLPPSVQDYVPPGHPAHLIRDLATHALDLSEVYAGYTGSKGQPPFDPRLMVALLLFAYTQGIYSSRRIAKACEQRLDFMAIVGQDRPDFRTIALFRQRHGPALQGLFGQSLQLCAKAGMVRLQHVSLDGSKFKANASKHKAMSYARMASREQELERQVASWLEQAGEVDEQEEQRYGKHRGDEMPAWVADKQKRLERIREARLALEAEAKERAMQEAAGSPRKGGPGKAPASEEPKGSTQRNFVDPQSRIMKSKDGFIQGYNAQVAVDADHQVIVAQGVTQSGSDAGQLQPMVERVEQGCGQLPKELSADRGYCSEGNLRCLQERGIRGYVAVGRQKHPATGKSTHCEQTELMRRRLKQGGHRSRYRLRKQVVEPVFGQIKQARGFRQFLTRGLENVSMEWSLLCTAHNLLKWMQHPEAMKGGVAAAQIAG